MQPWHQCETVTLERDGAIALLTLNRPDRLNAMTAKMLFEEIPTAIDLVAADDDIRVLILTGAGRGFCSGREVAEIAEQAGQSQRAIIPGPAGKESKLLRELQIPVVAAVNGVAAGAGLGLALTCDFRIASDESRFLESHVQRGLSPSVASWYLPRLVGLARTMEIIMTGVTLSATEALEAGLVNRVVPHGELMAESLTFARQLAELPPFAVKATKHAIMAGLGTGLDENLELIGRLRALGTVLTDEASEAAAKFLKR